MLTGCTGSVGHRKALAILFSVQPGCFIEQLVIAQRRIANARQLVRQRAGGLVVVEPPWISQRRESIAYTPDKRLPLACCVPTQPPEGSHADLSHSQP